MKRALLVTAAMSIAACPAEDSAQSYDLSTVGACPVDQILVASDAPCTCDGTTVNSDWITGECYCRDTGIGFGCPIRPSADELLCTNTGGTWDTGGCVFRCGEPEACFDAEYADCDCALGSTFDTVAGCQVDASCDITDRDACWASADHLWVERQICNSTNFEIDADACYRTCGTACLTGTVCASLFIDPCQGSLCAAACPGSAYVCLPFVSSCHVVGDCQDTLGYYCTPPEHANVCGMCAGGTACTDDNECGGGTMICDSEALPTQCPTCGGGKICLPGCTSGTECLTGQTCTADHRCLATTCTVAGDCPAHFACNGGSCARQTCATNADCGTGSCVLGSCYSSPGYCTQPVP